MARKRPTRLDWRPKPKWEFPRLCRGARTYFGARVTNLNEGAALLAEFALLNRAHDAVGKGNCPMGRKTS